MSESANRAPESAAVTRRQGPTSWNRVAGLSAPATAAGSLSTRRRIVRFGPCAPVLFICLTVAVASALGQPLRGAFVLGDLALWSAATAALSLPFISALIVMATARRGGLVWSTSLVYTLVAGLLGLGVDISVLGSEASTAPLGLISALIVQVLLLAPLSAAVAFVVHIVRQRG